MISKKLIMRAAEPVINPVTQLVLKKHYSRQKEIHPLEQSTQVLIIAPHMDDETIGLGGTIVNYKKQGTKVHCVFVTDGAGSNGTLEREQVSEARKKEISQVQELLGMDYVYYLDIPDGQVKDNETAYNELTTLILEIGPEVIYTTGNIDAHPDHVATAQLLSNVLKHSAAEPVIRQYEINCPVPPDEINCVMDITDSFDLKKKATEAFKSQVIAFDGFLLLSRVKSNLVTASSISYVETFIQLSKNEFIAQTEKLKEKNYTYSSLFKQANRTVTLLWAIYKNYDAKKRIYSEGRMK
ncbi:PIG-L deacetylase family protein [Jeotgalibacillus proteolyticus]|uniref:PIG-L deacetylase family protein n=1 Tax=Jeotgalibacillus proteolyticus TaxID=2082395 RepID=UPI003CE985CE